MRLCRSISSKNAFISQFQNLGILEKAKVPTCARKLKHTRDVPCARILTSCAECFG